MSKPTIAAAALLLLAVTWLAYRGMEPEAPRYDRALAALDRFEMAENAQRRNILGARVGLVRNYDRLVQEGNALRTELERLRQSGVETQVLAPLAALVDRQEALTETFKTDNALLQNSLAYFGLLSGEFAIPDQDVPLASEVSRLAATMLLLTVDRSVETRLALNARLNDLAAQVPPAADKQAVQALLAHGRLLRNLLPETDAVVRALYALPREQRQQAVRASIVAHQRVSRAVATQYRALLYLTSLLLLAVLMHLGLQLRRRVLAQQRRAAFERTIGQISMRFINSRHDEVGDLIEQALAALAAWAHADRAYFIMSGAHDLRYEWRGTDIPFQPGWPEGCIITLRHIGAADGLVHVPQVARMRCGPARDILTRMGVRGWACVASMSSPGTNVVLGFDLVRQPFPSAADDLGLLHIALDVVCNAVSRDIFQRERRRLESRARHARRMETVGALASGVAHNFNNITGAILGYAEMAETEADTGSRIMDHLDAIRRAGERARGLVDQILTFGQGRELATGRVDLRHLLGEAASMLDAGRHASARVVIEEVPDAAVVMGHAPRLLQVIINLCNNAIQAMDKDGVVHVTTELHRITAQRALSHGRLSPGAYVRIVVQDDGRGMDHTTIQQLFRPFFTTRQGGNGLGLATARAIVDEHVGGMHVQSAPGEGSLFEVWLPCAAAAGSAHPTEPPASPCGSGEAILLIDDDTNRLLRGEEICAALGYEAIGLSALEDAFAAYQAAPARFDAVVIAHFAPLELALALAARLRRAAPHLPILLAAAADAIGAEVLAATGISQLIAQPLVAAELAAALKRCLEGHPLA